jgi:hypothetical protein
MATYTITTPVNYDTLTGAATSNDTININGGKLTIDTDTRWCNNHWTYGCLGAVTISATLGGELVIDGTNVRIIPFDSGSGNVPAVGTSIVQGSVSAQLLGVWSALNAAPTAAGSAMPASGYIKVKNKSGGNFSAGALTNIGATATAADSVGWIEVIGYYSQKLVIPRLGKITVRGEWFEAGTTNGSANQTVQLPASLANHYYPGVWIETGVGTGQYEFYPAAGSITSAVANDVRGKMVWISSQGLLRIGNNGSINAGYVPPSGCKIRIPNVCLLTATTNGANYYAVAYTSKFAFDVATGGTCDIDKANILWYAKFWYGYSLSITNTAIIDMLDAFYIALPVTMSNIGNGFGLVQDSTTHGLNLKGCSVILTDGVFCRNSNTGGYCAIFDSNFDCVFNNLKLLQMVNKTSTAYVNTAYSNRNLTFNTLKIIGGTFQTEGLDYVLNNVSYSDVVSGTTVGAQSPIFNVKTNSDGFTLNGLDFFGLTEVNPYGMIVTLNSGVFNIRIQNIGTKDNYLNLGTTYPCGQIINTNGGNYAIIGAIVKRIYVTNLRLYFWSTQIMNDDILVENVYCDKTLTVGGKNVLVKGYGGTNTTTGQSSAYGHHYEDMFVDATNGRMVIACNEKTEKSPSVDAYVLTAGTGCGFTSTGNLVMPNLTDEIIWTWSARVIGHTGFGISAPTITGTNPNNFDLFYDLEQDGNFSGTYRNLSYKRAGGGGSSGAYVITMTSTAGVNPGDYVFGTNVGSGAKVLTVDSGTNITVNVANIGTVSGVLTFNHAPSETINDAASGFKLRVKAKVNTASSTNTLTFIRIDTITNATARLYQYPLNQVTAYLNLTGLIAGSEVDVYRVSDGVLIDSQITGSTTYTYEYLWNEEDIPVVIMVSKVGQDLIRYEGQSLTEKGLTIPVFQQASTNMKALQLIGGLPKTIELSTVLNYYDETTLVTTEIGVAGTGYNAAHTVFTLPNGETYDGTIDQLEVEVNGVGQIDGINYDYEDSVAASYITFLDAIPKNARVRFRKVL